MPDVKQNGFIVNALLRSALSERAKMKDLSLGVLNELYGGFLTDIQRDMIRSYYDYDRRAQKRGKSVAFMRGAHGHNVPKSGACA